MDIETDLKDLSHIEDVKRYKIVSNGRISAIIDAKKDTRVCDHDIPFADLKNWRSKRSSTYLICPMCNDLFREIIKCSNHDIEEGISCWNALFKSYALRTSNSPLIGVKKQKQENQQNADDISRQHLLNVLKIDQPILRFNDKKEDIDTSNLAFGASIANLQALAVLQYFGSFKDDAISKYEKLAANDNQASLTSIEVFFLDVYRYSELYIITLGILPPAYYSYATKQKNIHQDLECNQSYFLNLSSGRLLPRIYTSKSDFYVNMKERGEMSGMEIHSNPEYVDLSVEDESIIIDEWKRSVYFSIKDIERIVYFHTESRNGVEFIQTKRNEADQSEKLEISNRDPNFSAHMYRDSLFKLRSLARETFSELVRIYSYLLQFHYPFNEMFKDKKLSPTETLHFGVFRNGTLFEGAYRDYDFSQSNVKFCQGYEDFGITRLPVFPIPRLLRRLSPFVKELIIDMGHTNRRLDKYDNWISGPILELENGYRDIRPHLTKLIDEYRALHPYINYDSAKGFMEVVKECFIVSYLESCGYTEDAIPVSVNAIKMDKCLLQCSECKCKEYPNCKKEGSTCLYCTHEGVHELVVNQNLSRGVINAASTTLYQSFLTFLRSMVSCAGWFDEPWINHPSHQELAILASQKDSLHNKIFSSYILERQDEESTMLVWDENFTSNNVIKFPPGNSNATESLSVEKISVSMGSCLSVLKINGLTNFNLESNGMSNLKNLKALVELQITNCVLEIIPAYFASFTKMKRLQIHRKYIRKLPEIIFKSIPPRLESISLINCTNFEENSDEVWKFPSPMFREIEMINATREKILDSMSPDHKFPDPTVLFYVALYEYANLQNVTRLTLDYMYITNLPECLYNMNELTYLSLKGNRLFTDNLLNNHLKERDHDELLFRSPFMNYYNVFRGLSKLRNLDLSDSLITYLPCGVIANKHIQFIDLRKNKIRKLQPSSDKIELNGLETGNVNTVAEEMRLRLSRDFSSFLYWNNEKRYLKVDNDKAYKKVEHLASSGNSSSIQFLQHLQL